MRPEKATTVTDTIVQWLLGGFFAAGAVSTCLLTLLPAVQKGHRVLLGVPLVLGVALLISVAFLARQSEDGRAGYPVEAQYAHVPSHQQ